MQTELSDMDYLKSKVVKSQSPSSSEEEESEDEAVSCGAGSGAEEEEEAPGPAPTQQDRGRPGAGAARGSPSRNETAGVARAEVCAWGCALVLGGQREEGGQLPWFSLTFPAGPAFSSRPCCVPAV